MIVLCCCWVALFLYHKLLLSCTNVVDLLLSHTCALVSGVFVRCHYFVNNKGARGLVHILPGERLWSFNSA